MALKRRFQTGFEELDTNVPGLEQADDGEITLVRPDGSEIVLDEAALGPGGSTPDLAAVLAEGNDANGAKITNLDDPAADQDAATKKYVDDNAGGPGGSTPGTVRLLDLGVVDVVDLYSEDPPVVTLYTPAEGELVGPVFLSDVNPTPDSSFVVVVAPEEGGRLLAMFANSDIAEGYFVANANAEANDNAMPLATTSLLVGLSEDSEALIPATFPPPATWQSGHVYAQYTMIVEAGREWYADPAGTSGGVEPDFAGNIGGTVVDNDFTWNDNGAVTAPSGSAHVYVLVATPVTP